MENGKHTLSPRNLFTFLKKLRLHEIILIILIVVVLGVWGIKEMTESALFCGNSCHVMKPHYEEWKISGHHDVPCIECHIPPREGQHFTPDFRALGQVMSYLTRTYGRYTRAEVEDTSCLRDGCHTQRLLEGNVTYAADITFNHTPHLQQLRRGKILRCTTCHARNVMGEHIAVVHDTCFICHFKGDRSKIFTAQCIVCHKMDRPSGEEDQGEFDHDPYIERTVPCDSCHAGITTGNGQLYAEACKKCHGPSGVPTPDLPPETLHNTHVTRHKVECGMCHLPIRHEMQSYDAHASQDCGSCHESRHAGIINMYRGTGAMGVSSEPSPMFLKRVACIGCHRLSAPGNPVEIPFRGDTLVANDAMCSQCHGNDMADLLEEWTFELSTALDLAEEMLRRANGYVDGLMLSGINAETERLLDESRRNILFLRTSSPLHNHDYAVAILQKTAADLDRIMTGDTQR